jgi:polo-like kinase 1
MVTAATDKTTSKVLKEGFTFHEKIADTKKFNVWTLGKLLGSGAKAHCY